VTNSAVLWVAWRRLERRGGPAPGPDGIRYGDVTGTERWKACRDLRDGLRDGSYRPGRERIVQVPKVGRPGTRPICLQPVPDRVVQAAVATVVGPFLDTGFDANSFGYRAGRDRTHALALAEWYAVHEGRTVWVLADIKDAFGSVPVGRLLQVLESRLPCGDLTELVRQVLRRNAPGTSSKRGLRQGGPLSPVMLNLYLDHLLDRPWRGEHPDVPLVRFADDVLVLCRTADEARACLHDLSRLLTPTGMRLKAATEAETIRDLGAGKSADWLGFRVRLGRQGLLAGFGRGAWQRLESKLLRAHEHPNSSLAADAAVRGWLDQNGPCYRRKSVPRVADRIAEACRRAAFEEYPDQDEVRDLWGSAHDRWEQTRRSVAEEVAGGCRRDSVQS
jgi:RNA-directed DNA polymerase